MTFRLIKCPQIALAAFARCAKLSCDLQDFLTLDHLNGRSVFYIFMDEINAAVMCLFVAHFHARGV